MDWRIGVWLIDFMLEVFVVHYLHWTQALSSLYIQLPFHGTRWRLIYLATSKPSATLVCVCMRERKRVKEGSVGMLLIGWFGEGGFLPPSCHMKEKTGKRVGGYLGQEPSSLNNTPSPKSQTAKLLLDVLASPVWQPVSQHLVLMTADSCVHRTRMPSSVYNICALEEAADCPDFALDIWREGGAVFETSVWCVEVPVRTISRGLRCF